MNTIHHFFDTNEVYSLYTMAAKLFGAPTRIRTETRRILNSLPLPDWVTGALIGMLFHNKLDSDVTTPVTSPTLNPIRPGERLSAYVALCIIQNLASGDRIELPISSR